MTAPVIEVQGLMKTYQSAAGPVQAVNGVSFAVQPGEIYGLLGPNGAGKTSTVEILEGIRPATEGTVLVAGVDVRRTPAAVKPLIGVQLQASTFFDNLTLLELLEVFASFYGHRVDGRALLREVELDDKRGAYFAQLSGGQKQRFSLAAALVNDLIVLFLDEPSTGLDPQARRHLWNLVQRIRAAGKTVVLTTHFMDEAEMLCDRVAIMDQGRIIAEDTPQGLIEALLAKGFRRQRVEQLANLEDVFLDLTGRELREE